MAINFVVEDGTGLTNSNAYVSVEFYKQYQKDHGRTVTQATGALQSAIIVSSDYIDYRWVFIGERLNPNQSMEWPRVDAFYSDGRPALGVPVEVQEACCEYAYIQATTGALVVNPEYDATNAPVLAKEQHVGPIGESFQYGGGGSKAAFRKYPSADNRLKELVVQGHFLKRA